MTTSRSPLVDQVLLGDNHQLVLLAASGMLPLAPHELVPLQIQLVSHPDSDIALRAAAAIEKLDVGLVESFVAHDADVEALQYFAERSKRARVLEAVLRRRDAPRVLLRRLAARIGPDLQEVLLLRQDAIVEEPAILDALETNPELSAFSRRRIVEYRQHLLRIPGAPVDVDDEEAERAEIQAAIEAVQQIERDGEFDESTGLSESQIRMLPVHVRLKLARGAPRTLRNILIRDVNSQVCLEVLRGNALGDSEIEQIAKSRMVSDEILDEIGRNREWSRRYQIIFALATNPKSPLPLAMRMVAQLAVRDLRNLARDRNVPDAVRSTAQRFYKVKSR